MAFPLPLKGDEPAGLSGQFLAVLASDSSSSEDGGDSSGSDGKGACGGVREIEDTASEIERKITELETELNLEHSEYTTMRMTEERRAHALEKER